MGDLWLHVTIASPHHQISFFFSMDKQFFFVGNKSIRVEHVGIESKVLV